MFKGGADIRIYFLFLVNDFSNKLLFKPLTIQLEPD